MTLNTYGHVMDDLVGARRTDAETAIREARASSCVIGSLGADRTSQKRLQ
jgi:hypothetical protein